MPPNLINLPLDRQRTTPNLAEGVKHWVFAGRQRDFPVEPLMKNALPTRRMSTPWRVKASRMQRRSPLTASQAITNTHDQTMRKLQTRQITLLIHNESRVVIERKLPHSHPLYQDAYSLDHLGGGSVRYDDVVRPNCGQNIVGGGQC